MHYNYNFLGYSQSLSQSHIPFDFLFKHQKQSSPQKALFTTFNLDLVQDIDGLKTLKCIQKLLFKQVLSTIFQLITGCNFLLCPQYFLLFNKGLGGRFGNSLGNIETHCLRIVTQFLTKWPYCCLLLVKSVLLPSNNNSNNKLKAKNSFPALLLKEIILQQIDLYPQKWCGKTPYVVIVCTAQNILNELVLTKKL